LSFVREKNINDIIYSALRELDAYPENEQPDPEMVNNALEAFQDIIDDIEINDGVSIIQKEWRQRTFEESNSIKGDTDNYYRCIKTHNVPDITTWQASTSYQNNVYVYPTTENGYYYKAIVTANPDNEQAQGLSGLTEPSFPEYQNETVIDNQLTWKAIPDTKPETGKNFSAYWVQDDSIESADDYAVNQTYRSASDILLDEDEAYIIDCFFRHITFDRTPIEIINSKEYASLKLKWLKGIPTRIYLDHIDKNTRYARLEYTPQLTGPSGYVLHYLVAKRSKNYNDGSDKLNYSENWNRALKWMLISEIQGEHNVSIEEKHYNDRKAVYYYKKACKSKTQKRTRRMIKSCFTRH